MRRISFLLIPLLVVFLQTAAYAIDHWGGGPTPTGGVPPTGLTVAAMVAYVALMGLIGMALVSIFPGTNPRCAYFVAVASVATMVTFAEWFFMIGVGLWVPDPGNIAQEAMGVALKMVFFAFMIVSLVQCCLNKRLSPRHTLLLALAAALVPEALQWLFRFVVPKM